MANFTTTPEDEQQQQAGGSPFQLPNYLSSLLGNAGPVAGNMAGTVPGDNPTRAPIQQPLTTLPVYNPPTPPAPTDPILPGGGGQPPVQNGPVSQPGPVPTPTNLQPVTQRNSPGPGWNWGGPIPVDTTNWIPTWYPPGDAIPL